MKIEASLFYFWRLQTFYRLAHRVLYRYGQRDVEKPARGERATAYAHTSSGLRL